MVYPIIYQKYKQVGLHSKTIYIISCIKSFNKNNQQTEYQCLNNNNSCKKKSYIGLKLL